MYLLFFLSMCDCEKLKDNISFFSNDTQNFVKRIYIYKYITHIFLLHSLSAVNIVTFDKSL